MDRRGINKESILKNKKGNLLPIAKGPLYGPFAIYTPVTELYVVIRNTFVD